MDHPDGLRDPGGYLDDLAALTGGAYVLVEKILEPGETLLSSWATAGTTGYDALGLVDRVLTDPAGEAPLTALAERLGAPTDWAELIHGSKRAIADRALHPEVRRIVRDLAGPEGEGTRPEPPSFVDAVAELLACFPVYRSYLPDGRAAPRPRVRGRASSPARPGRRRSTGSSPCCATAGTRRRCASSRPAAW